MLHQFPVCGLSGAISIVRHLRVSFGILGQHCMLRNRRFAAACHKIQLLVTGSCSWGGRVTSSNWTVKERKNGLWGVFTVHGPLGCAIHPSQTTPSWARLILLVAPHQPVITAVLP